MRACYDRFSPPPPDLPWLTAAALAKANLVQLAVHCPCGHQISLPGSLGQCARLPASCSVLFSIVIWSYHQNQSQSVHVCYKSNIFWMTLSTLRRILTKPLKHTWYLSPRNECECVYVCLPENLCGSWGGWRCNNLETELMSFTWHTYVGMEGWHHHFLCQLFFLRKEFLWGCSWLLQRDIRPVHFLLLPFFKSGPSGTCWVIQGSKIPLTTHFMFP